MKLRLLESIRCPACRSAFRLEAASLGRVDRAFRKEGLSCRGICPFPQLTGQARDCATCLEFEVMGGSLVCIGCQRSFAIVEAIPELFLGDLAASHPILRRTASSYGYLWKHAPAPPPHLERIQRHLPSSFFKGAVLDAGCGQGVDLAHTASRKDLEVVGVELSVEGCWASFRRCLPFPTAHVIRADLSRLPFSEGSFDSIYSYGVFHLLASPSQGMAELSRVLKPGGRMAVYVYEDFSDRAKAWRWALALVNRFRALAVRLPHPLLYFLCLLASPVVYLIFTVPYRELRRIPGLTRWVESLPFRHAQGPFALSWDLYDRFSPPVEFRYSRPSAIALLKEAGLESVQIANERGWVVSGVKPC